MKSHKPLCIRNGLKIYTKLEQRTPLKATKGLNRISPKQKAENAVWFKIKIQRITDLIKKFGFIKCEYCLKPIKVSEIGDAHHADKIHWHNEYKNARIVHRTCHDYITNHKVDVPSLL